MVHQKAYLPIITSFIVLFFVTTFFCYIHNILNGSISLFFFLILIYMLCEWWYIMIYESFEGAHTLPVQKGLKIGMILFIVSEVMFFFAFFWAFFHSSLAPTIEIGAIWPPNGILPFYPWKNYNPTFNTVILLQSGACITLTHFSIINNNYYHSICAIIHTLGFALAFSINQLFEYIVSPFSIYDGIYGSVFFMATGLHGLHVIVGTLFIFICAIRLKFGQFNNKHHIGFEAAAWYWHFVDVVWLFLYISIYWWGNI